MQSGVVCISAVREMDGLGKRRDDDMHNTRPELKDCMVEAQEQPG